MRRPGGFFRGGFDGFRGAFRRFFDGRFDGFGGRGDYGAFLDDERWQAAGQEAVRIVAHPVPGFTGEIALRGRTRTRGVARIALVIEQFGHHELAASRQRLEMRESFSMAILPSLP